MKYEYALLLLALGACSEERKTAPVARIVAPLGPTLAESPIYRVHATTPAPCRADQSCVASVVVVALGEYKINVEYPTKFVADPMPGVAVQAEGAFAVEEKQRGTMTIQFRPAQAGTARISGKLKLSVCTEQNCEIEAPAIALDIPVS